MTIEEVSRDWRPPADLGFSGMRPVSLTGAGIALSVLTIAMVTGGLLLGGFLWKQSERQEAERQILREHGVVAKATVLRVWRSGDKDATPRVRYRFSVDGNEHISSKSVPSRIWRTLEEGADIEVRYAPEN